MGEINLLERYPKTKRVESDRALNKVSISENRWIARDFGEEFFDGSRETGYGGYKYKPEFWEDVVESLLSNEEDMRRHGYRYDQAENILDVGCGKGFMLSVMKRDYPLVNVCGVDISDYALEKGHWRVKPFLQKGCASDLSRFEDKEFDLAVSINTVHNLPYNDCKKAILELQRVSYRQFLTVDAWRNDKEKEEMKRWNLTAQTIMHVDDWKNLFEDIGYKGDYYWFFPGE